MLTFLLLVLVGALVATVGSVRNWPTTMPVVVGVLAMLLLVAVV